MGWHGLAVRLLHLVVFLLACVDLVHRSGVVWLDASFLCAASHGRLACLLGFAAHLIGSSARLVDSRLLLGRWLLGGSLSYSFTWLDFLLSYWLVERLAA